MASVYPGALDTFATNKADGTVTPTDHPAHHNDLADAVNKIEAELGIDPAGTFATVAARLLGGQTLIERIVAGGALASFDFQSIPGTFETLEIVLLARGDNNSAAIAVGVRFNNDSGANYNSQSLRGSGAVVTAAIANGATSIAPAAIPALTALADSAGALRYMIPGYARTVFNKILEGTSGYQGGTDATGLTVRAFSGDWDSTAAITRVTLLPTAGNFIVGSVCSLYGIG